MRVSSGDVRDAIAGLELSGTDVCLHSSLSSFGRVTGGAGAVVSAFLDEDVTLLVPAFSFDANAVDPPPGSRIDRNGWDYSRAWFGRSIAAPYEPGSYAIDRRMGAIPTAVVRRDDRIRGDHPMCSFAAVGRNAGALVSGQTPDDVFAPLRTLAERGGSVVLAGVGLTRFTLLHLAEQQAGRAMFVRWASDADGSTVVARVGGCSEGFGNLRRVLEPVERSTRVGGSEWLVYDAGAALEAAARAIAEHPDITRCRDVLCVRCRDAVRGGPRD